MLKSIIGKILGIIGRCLETRAVSLPWQGLQGSTWQYQPCQLHLKDFFLLPGTLVPNEDLA